MWTTGIGQKLLVGLSGLGLVGFIITHMLGNLTMFATETGGDLPSGGIVDYAHALHDLPGFTIIESGLLLLFVVHIVLVIRLVRANRAARGDTRYARSQSKRATGAVRGFTSRMMAVSGITLLLFLAVHIWDLRLQREHIAAMETAGTGNLFTHLEALLSHPGRACLYVLGSLLVGWHLFHGFESAFRSLGFNHRRYGVLLTRLGALLAVIVGVGFAIMPIWFLIR